MTEELKKEAERYIIGQRQHYTMDFDEVHRLVVGFAEDKITDLEKQISILLSCKDCPDNKGGYICEKEYNDKCLAQKIQYIKELQEEIEGLRTDVQNRPNVEVENIELKKQIVDLKDYVLKVSKFLHNNNNTKPDKLAYKERDMLLIKELKLFEKLERNCSSRTSKGVRK